MRVTLLVLGGGLLLLDCILHVVLTQEQLYDWAGVVELVSIVGMLLLLVGILESTQGI
jgi:hypothetical protein